MSPNVAGMIAAAKALPPAEWRELVDTLNQLDDTTGDGLPVLSEETWREIERLSAEYDAGRAETVSWEDVKARWAARWAAGG